MRLVDAGGRLMLANENDTYVGRSFVEYGEFSHLEAEFLATLLAERDGDVCEVGANIGAHTVALAGCCERIWPIEPQRLVFQTLCANLALNDVRNAYPIWAACGDETGSVTVPDLSPDARMNFGGVSLEKVSAGDVAPMIRVDQLDMPELRLLKIDVEGMELSVLQGARNAIERHRPTIYVENDREEKSERLLEHLMGALGYECWWHFPPLFRMENYRQNFRNVFPGIVSVNMLCLPAENAKMGNKLLPGSHVRHKAETWSEAIVRLSEKAA